MADFDKWIANYMGYVDWLTAFIPYRRTSVWREFLLSPASVPQKDDVGIGGRLKDLYVMTAANYLLVAIMMLPAIVIMGLMYGSMLLMSGGISLITLAVFAVVAVALYILTPIGYFLYSLLELLVAKVLGGRGSMSANFSASTLPLLAIFLLELPIFVLMIPLQWLGAVPIVSICASCIGIVPQLIMMAMGIYSLFLKYEAMKAVHKISPIRAAAVVLVPALLMWTLVIIAFVLMYAAFYAMIMGMTTIPVAPAAGPA